MKNKVLRSIPIVGVLNIIVAVVVLLLAVWEREMLYVQILITQAVFHGLLIFIEHMLKDE